MTGTAEYRGRFAPSPTGPLHFGSLVAAVASYLQALKNNGIWLVRVEDIDPTREHPESARQILDSLEAHGFRFEPPLFQSTRLDNYNDIIEQLIADNAAYRCSCSRKEIRKSAPAGCIGHIYPGTCRDGADTTARPATSVRMRTTNEEISFTDQLQGELNCHPESEIGDFLIRRGDGLVAYQLAVVIDDYAQGITEIVRGTDLLKPTFMQIWLRKILTYPEPAYMHFPVATGPDDRKLAKQTGAPKIDNNRPLDNLFEALAFLDQNPDIRLKSLSLDEFWKEATVLWNPALLQGQQSRKMGV
jgi:glutamyl-Q tRNA(Asp) synthetase